MASTKVPRPPTPYRLENVRRIMDDAVHHLHGLALAYCYDLAPGNEVTGREPKASDLRWADEVEAEMARAYESAMYMIKHLRESEAEKP